MSRRTAGVSDFGAPVQKTPRLLATAYQATDPTKAAIVTINLSSTAALSLSGGTVCTANVVMGPSAAVASGTGTAVDKYGSTLTGTLVVGLAVNNGQVTPCIIHLPKNWYYAVIQTGAGTVAIDSVFDQTVG